MTVEEQRDLSDYERGFLDALWLYGWWKDGVVYVGTTGMTYAEARRRFLKARERVPEVSS